MSQRSRSIADVLKTVPFKRPTAQPAPAESAYASQQAFDDLPQSSPSDAYEMNESSQVDDSPVAYEDQYDPEPEPTSHRSAPAEDLISRLTRLHGSARGGADQEDAPADDLEEERHRATSRQRQRRVEAVRKKAPAPRPVERRPEPASDEEYSDRESYQEAPRRGARPTPTRAARQVEPEWEEPVRPRAPTRPTENPYRTSRRSGSRRSATDHSDYYPAPRSPTRRPYPTTPVEPERAKPVATRSTLGSSRGRRPAPPVAAPRPRAPAPKAPTRYQAPVEDRDDRPTPRRAAAPAGKGVVLEEDYFDDREAPAEEVPVESVDQGRDGSAFPFTALSKTAIAKIAKVVGVPSLSADIYDTVRELSGEFVYDVLAQAAQSGEVVSSAELEPIVERRLGRQVEDLDQSFVNSNTFVKWLRAITDELQIRLRNEAVLFLQNCVEYHLVELMSNARDVAEQARRSRLTIKDILLGARMR